MRRDREDTSRERFRQAFGDLLQATDDATEALRALEHARQELDKHGAEMQKYAKGDQGEGGTDDR
jgi:hypothetical protein